MKLFRHSYLLEMNIRAERYRVEHEQRLLVFVKVDEAVEVGVDVPHIHHCYFAVMLGQKRH